VVVPCAIAHGLLVSGSYKHRTVKKRKEVRAGPRICIEYLPTYIRKSDPGHSSNSRNGQFLTGEDFKNNNLIACV